MHTLFSENSALLSANNARLRQLLLKELLAGRLSADLLPQLMPQQSMLVILCESFDPAEPLNIQQLQQGLTDAGLDAACAELVPIDSHCAIVLKGNATIRRFQNFSNRQLQEEPGTCWVQPCPNNLFLSYGCVIEDPAQLPDSYRLADELMHQRFFCSAGEHILLPEQLLCRGDHAVATMLLLESYTHQLLQYIQTFNRLRTAQTLTELHQIMLRGNDSPNSIRLFFVDLYLRIKEQMTNQYQGYSIPFYSNTHIIRSIFQMNCLEEIILFLSQRFDMIMSSIGASSRESVLDDILHYIQHNFHTSITLEDIAPLFGYNHSYLGKIFRKKMSVSFNEYVDRLRIAEAKKLLLSDDAKVYVISERVGYKNVDYFHVKFRKYENMSPAEFRKAHKKLSTSPDGEKLEKGPLFFE